MRLVDELEAEGPLFQAEKRKGGMGQPATIYRINGERGYAVRGSSETFVRRIALDPTKNRISVPTDHPAYPSWNGVQRKAINVVGRVIWIGSQVS